MSQIPKKNTNLFWRWIDSIGLILLLCVAVPMLVLPWPIHDSHIVEKMQMIANGQAFRPRDWVDVVMHTLPCFVLFVKLGRLVALERNPLVDESLQMAEPPPSADASESLDEEE